MSQLEQYRVQRGDKLMKNVLSSFHRRTFIINIEVAYTLRGVIITIMENHCPRRNSNGERCAIILDHVTNWVWISSGISVEIKLDRVSTNYSGYEPMLSQLFTRDLLTNKELGEQFRITI